MGGVRHHRGGGIAGGLVRLVIAVCMVLGSAGVAWADDTSMVALKQFGLEGVWARDCAQPVSRSNPRVSWKVTAEGEVRHGVTFDGVTESIQDAMGNARALGEDELSFTVLRDGDATFFVIIRRTERRVATVQSIGANGVTYLDNGVDMETGRPAVSYERCDGTSPLS